MKGKRWAAESPVAVTTRMRVLYVVTHGMTARHLLTGQLAWMGRGGYEVAVACSPGPDFEETEEREGVDVFEVPMSREISPLADARAVVRLARSMRRWRPVIVNAGTPKAGLLGLLAARMAGVPVRIYTLRGLRLEHMRGVKRAVLSTSERVAVTCATDVLAVSGSLRQRYLELGLAPVEKVRVLGSGASNGVDVERFAPRPWDDELVKLRDDLGMPPGIKVIGFVGRLTRDKGIVELVEAVDRVRREVPDVQLLLVGDFEEGDPVPQETINKIRISPHIFCAGFVPDSAPYYQLMDVLAFPSYREGFPNAPLEAAAMGLPVAGFRATGTADAVVNGQTGSLVEVGDADGLAAALARYLTDPALALAHGRAGQERVRREFTNERVWEALAAEYERLLALRAPERLRRSSLLNGSRAHVRRASE